MRTHTNTILHVDAPLFFGCLTGCSDGLSRLRVPELIPAGKRTITLGPDDTVRPVKTGMSRRFGIQLCTVPGTGTPQPVLTVQWQVSLFIRIIMETPHPHEIIGMIM